MSNAMAKAIKKAVEKGVTTAKTTPTLAGILCCDNATSFLENEQKTCNMQQSIVCDDLV